MQIKHVPLVDIKRHITALKSEFDGAYHEILKRGDFILGKAVDDFEREFADYAGVQYCIGVSSGTDALILAFRALDLDAQSEVLVPSHTFVATVIGILEAGLTPVLVDIDPQSGLLDLESARKAVSNKTKAICPVHLYGRACAMEKISAFAQEYNLFVIEDAAQAHGACAGNKKVGSIGHMGCFSFYPGKNLGAFGDAGCIVTNSDAIANKLKSIRNYGSTVKYVHEQYGINARLDSMQAAFLSVKLPHLDSWNRERWNLASLYDELLRPLQGKVARPDLVTAQEHVFHLYVIQVERREEVLKKLTECGIGAGIHYPIPIHLQNGFKDRCVKRVSLAHTEQFASRILSLPLFPLMTEEEAHSVVDALKRVI